MDELLEAICAHKRAPKLSLVTANILALCNNPDVDFDKLGIAVSADTELTAKLVQIANSALFGSGRRVETANDAIVRMGLKVMRLVVLGLNLHKQLTRNVPTEFDIQRFWRHCLTTGATARAITQAVWPAERDDALSIGLLQDIGMVALQCVLPKEYAKVLKGRREHPEAQIPELEYRVFYLTHMVVGSELVRRWNFPAKVYEPIGHHHAVEGCAELEALSPDVANLVRIVRLSGIASSLFHGWARIASYNELTTRARHELSIAPEQLSEVLSSVEDHVRELSVIFDVDVSSFKPYADIEAELVGKGKAEHVAARRDVAFSHQP